MTGMMAPMVLDGPINGDWFEAYVGQVREPFLSHVSQDPMCVVHGHTITDAPDVRQGRVGIDTGAYASGRLTAIGLEGAERWFLEAQ